MKTPLATLPIPTLPRGVEIAMDRPSATMFPSVGMHVLSATIHFIGVTILAHIISRRIMIYGSSMLKGASWPSICLLMIFIDSWLFIFASGVLILGTGLERNELSCSMGIFLCIIFYGISKFLIYAFLCSSTLPSLTESRY